MNADGTNPTKVSVVAGSSHPMWSPDGAKIVFESNSDKHYQVFVMNSDGTGVTKLTNDPAGFVGPPWLDAAEPAWSPDGKWIVFRKVVDRAATNMKIFVMRPDGSGLLRLTDSASLDLNPRWSPDGRKIVFQSNRSGNYDIYAIDFTETR